MLTRRIIPCLDVTGGRVVKGTQFLDLRDAGDPVELAAYYDAEGADELTFYDITASSDGRDTMLDVVRRVAAQVFIPLTVGGGVRTVDDIYRLLRAGADKVSMNSAAVASPDLIAEGAVRFGSQCIVLSIDAALRPGGAGWEVRTHGGRRGTGLDAIEWARRGVELGAGEIVLNSIDADGTREGYDLALNAAVAATVRVPVVASGGAGTLAHLHDALDAGAHAVLAASIFHYRTHTVREAKEYLAARGLPMRRTWSAECGVRNAE
ncbi:MAG: Imidazole glycerol phosphate synthase cyclase subunit HisF [uncultured Thermomicrobiales bacterium]|uniref:Imidazole glycerol phosphate synthase subunit HisF n=1 Tax=uncultured Thermomicrobiales bacterium TaxID=1645740 RepID=A0A6J4UPB4_9BACT|nr:MAG: Imidazole glycerol phosphate synthase cyclase subunit HisF [uncultured Thermomicrobiales bacterium]